MGQHLVPVIEEGHHHALAAVALCHVQLVKKQQQVAAARIEPVPSELARRAAHGRIALVHARAHHLGCRTVAEAERGDHAVALVFHTRLGIQEHPQRALVDTPPVRCIHVLQTLQHVRKRRGARRGVEQGGPAHLGTRVVAEHVQQEAGRGRLRPAGLLLLAHLEPGERDDRLDAHRGLPVVRALQKEARERVKHALVQALEPIDQQRDAPTAAETHVLVARGEPLEQVLE